MLCCAATVTNPCGLSEFCTKGSLSQLSDFAFGLSEDLLTEFESSPAKIFSSADGNVRCDRPHQPEIDGRSALREESSTPTLGNAH